MSSYLFVAARNDKAFRPPPPVPTQQTKASPQLLGRGRRPPPPTPQFTEVSLSLNTLNILNPCPAEPRYTLPLQTV